VNGSLWTFLLIPAMLVLPLPAQEKAPPEWLIQNVTRWLPLVERWHTDFPELDPAWILGVIAQESQGFPHVQDITGSNAVGLMQIIPRSWTGTQTQLEQPGFNIYIGMWMLSATLQQTDGNLRRALAGYNCGLIKLDANGPKQVYNCGLYGGYAYADRIIDYWVPVFRIRLAEEAMTPDRVGDWLAKLGYRGGLGRWHAEKEILTVNFGCIPVGRNLFIC